MPSSAANAGDGKKQALNRRMLNASNAVFMEVGISMVVFLHG